VVVVVVAAVVVAVADGVSISSHSEMIETRSCMCCSLTFVSTRGLVSSVASIWPVIVLLLLLDMVTSVNLGCMAGM